MSSRRSFGAGAAKGGRVGTEQGGRSEHAVPRTVEWVGGAVRIIDQTALPVELKYVDLVSPEEVAEAIRTLKVRGAPAIGVTAALGVALAARDCADTAVSDKALAAIRLLGETRPTAVNLSWALERMRRALELSVGEGAGSVRQRLLREALDIAEEDKRLCERIGVNGERLLKDGDTVLTHCNAGALATAGSGTALAVVYAAVRGGKRIRVIADETRPLLQGARLTAWELVARGIEVTVICDSAAAWMMKQGRVNCVLVGADRVAANGDAANKIGSYSLAVAAGEHGVPFYVACPYSSIDLSLRDGTCIPIELRGEEELASFFGRRTVPQGARIENPAFDVVPNRLVSAIITEKGVLAPPYDGRLA
ncbi:MAG: S-methyl-5-thioribose-1-phosphate isomerase [Candidatus Eisenbacteria bacterium]|nr:S-methyl-5-thioribose-1-phosphate isomerase [Candidatus Eisenbacteria bacterium]